MHPDLLDILSKKEFPINNQQLVDYLTGKMTEEENHAFEKAIASSSIDNEAIEGLQMLRSKEKLLQYQLEINRKLNDSLHQKPERRQKRKIVQLPYLILLTFALLALIFVLWLLMHLIQANP